MNMLAAEFGYRVEWVMLPDGRRTGILRLINDQKDRREFQGEDKYEQAIEWLRAKA